MRVLLVSDLHYDLRKLDWLLRAGAEHDVVAVAGDLLDIASPVPLDTQSAVVLEYLSRLASRAIVVVCSGNHDLDHRGTSGEKATRWLDAARADGVHVDGDSVEVGDWLLTACAWWEGPATLAALEARLDAAALRRSGRWLWVWHGPPDGPLAWTGSRWYGDPELPRLVDRHAPDVVLCGHIHQAPFTADGSWHGRQGRTSLFNAGHQRGPEPAHVTLDLAAGRADWQSYAGVADVALELAQ
jgi:predicted MPP superfamily phosphohydrolase